MSHWGAWFWNLLRFLDKVLQTIERNRMIETPPPSPKRIMEMTWGFAPPLILEAAIRCRVFDVLDAGPLTIAELASKTSCSPRGLRAICNALVALRFLTSAGGRYSTTAESSAFLVTTKPMFSGGILLHAGRQLVKPWLWLAEIVRTGTPAARVEGQDEGAAFFADFVSDIFNMSAGAAMALGASMADRFKKPTRVLDIAAGSGVWGIMLAKASPAVSVTAVDWPGVIPVTKKIAARHGVADRFSYVEGNMHEVQFGTGFDLATLGHILHSEGAAGSEKLIKKVHAALAPGGTIAIAEFIPNEDRCDPPIPLMFAVNMLVNTSDGDTFTMKEITAWLTGAGFTNVRQFDAPGPSPLVLADKAW
jgi:ubiquinone/menaquinone biosynthesis C-methylase UbiE